jgi:hypothetical protein
MSQDSVAKKQARRPCSAALSKKGPGHLRDPRRLGNRRACGNPRLARVVERNDRIRAPTGPLSNQWLIVDSNGKKRHGVGAEALYELEGRARDPGSVA